MRLVIVTGMSGAGKSSVLKMLEDAGYFCVDNLPVPLILTFVNLTVQNREIRRVAVGIDIRNGQALEEIQPVMQQLEKLGIRCEILFLEASTEVLVKRYKETRRTHPLAGSGRVEEGIEQERRQLKFFKEEADYILDTSHLLVRELKSQIDHIFVQNGSYQNFFVTVVSFGFKYGILIDADLVFDVRFLANPYYVPELKRQTGNDTPVKDYVLNTLQAGIFLDKLEDLLNFLIPNYIAEGKNQLVIGIGCTGGKHRSVALTNELARRLKKTEYGIKADHRDIEKA